MSKNDGVPSWLTEETVTTATTNPVVQKAAVSAASNPAVQKAAVATATSKVNETAPGWAEPSGYTPPATPGAVAQPNEMPRDIESQRVAPDRTFDASPEEVKEIQKWHLYLRVCYMITAIMMSIGAVLTLDGASIATAFIAFYVFFFSMLMFCFECGMKAVSSIIGKLYTYTSIRF